jgi:hypothetical protein
MKFLLAIISAFTLFWPDGANAQAQAQLQAQPKLNAHYVLSLAAITIGGGDWKVEIGKDRYVAKSDGELLGIWRVILGSDITAVAHGSVSQGRLIPADYAANFAWDDEIEDVKMQFRDGGVGELEVKPTIPAGGDRIPLAPERLHGVIDPLTAGLISMAGTKDNLLSPATCQRTLPIFDGSQRYDLALSFKRMDMISTEKGYQGPVVVCAMAYQPVAGYSPGSFRVNYLKKNRDMEMWFAPVAGVRLLAMIRISIPTTLGTALLKATQFESAVASSQ